MLLLCAPAQAESKTELLWPDGAPGAKGTNDNDKPTLAISLPPADKATGAAVIVCPGGGYGGLAMGYEGIEVGQWLNDHGIAAFVLKYRHKGTGYEHPSPLDDAQRAIRTVRARAAEFHVDPQRIGILGFSAGGHLASSAGTHFDEGKPDAPDKIQRVSCRPDFLILCYPVISFVAPLTHQGSKKNLLGENPDPKLVESMSSELQVTPETPPDVSVAHRRRHRRAAGEQRAVLPGAAKGQESRPSCTSTKKAARPGPGQKAASRQQLARRCIDWIEGRGLLDRSKRS